MKKKSELESLSPKQKMAVLEFVRGKNLSYKEIAEKANVSTRTLYNWRKDFRFKKALEQAMSEVQAKVIETTGSVIGVNMLSEPMLQNMEYINTVYLVERLGKLEKYHRDYKKFLSCLVDVMHDFEHDIREIKTILIKDKNANEK